MPVSTNHSMLVSAFEHAETVARRRGKVHVVSDLVDWRNNYGSAKNRITTLYGLVTHHTGSEIGADRVVSYVRGLFSGSLRPEIGRTLCNTATVRAGVWPGSNGRPTVVVGAADYANHAGMGDSALLGELRDQDVDVAGEIDPGADNVYLNRYLWGDEGVGAYLTEDQTDALVEWYGPAMAFLGLHVDTDNDGRFAAVVGHRETTDRKVDPARVDLPALRRKFERYWADEYGVVLTDPLVSPAPAPDAGTALRVDGVLGAATIRKLQEVVGARVDGVWGPDSKRKTQAWLGVRVDGLFHRQSVIALQRRVGATPDGVWGRETTRKLQEFLNGRQAGAQAQPQASSGLLVVDGILGRDTVRAMQEWVGATPDGNWGPATTRALQAKVGARVDGVRGPETTRKLQETVGAHADGNWGPETTRKLQEFLNNRKAGAL